MSWVSTFSILERINQFSIDWESEIEKKKIFFFCIKLMFCPNNEMRIETTTTMDLNSEESKYFLMEIYQLRVLSIKRHWTTSK